jgi:hypothetical protein
LLYLRRKESLPEDDLIDRMVAQLAALQANNRLRRSAQQPWSRAAAHRRNIISKLQALLSEPLLVRLLNDATRRDMEHAIKQLAPSQGGILNAPSATAFNAPVIVPAAPPERGPSPGLWRDIAPILRDAFKDLAPKASARQINRFCAWVMPVLTGEKPEEDSIRKSLRG